MTEKSPTLLWLRRDLRLADHPALCAALARGGPVIPVFIHDDSVESLGAAPKWRLGLSLASLSRDLEDLDSRLILRRGEALEVLRALVDETGAGAVHWSRLYDPQA
ncbi:MAG: deoxyribodipyrimidine photo-lyase, partial [Roseovarius sp.]|uniref:deoxyribodipyrimidine photo-lyase n=1 Tax=Roseovarius sp. TaxID=1486281 RepID=UPI00405810ED